MIPIITVLTRTPYTLLYRVIQLGNYVLGYKGVLSENKFLNEVI